MFYLSVVQMHHRGIHYQFCPFLRLSSFYTIAFWDSNAEVQKNGEKDTLIERAVITFRTWLDESRKIFIFLPRKKNCWENWVCVIWYIRASACVNLLCECHYSIQHVPVIGVVVVVMTTMYRTLSHFFGFLRLKIQYFSL